MSEARDVDAMSLEQLRDEVWYWRTDAAAQLGTLMLVVGGGCKDLRGTPRKRAAYLVDLLGSAVAGEVHEICFVCAEPLRPGEAAINDVEMGDMHAACPTLCSGPPIQPGDKVFMDPEGIVWEGDGPKPDHIVAHAVERLYSAARIVEKLAAAQAVLSKAKAA